MAQRHSPRFLQIVNDAKKRIREVSVNDVKAKLDRNEKLVLVDVREESEYARDHLPGAIHLGKGIIERDIEQCVPELDTPQTTFKRWDIPTWARWTVVYVGGVKTVFH